MNRIVSKEHFSPHVVKLEVEAPLIARSRKAGHFVIVRVGEQGERIPLTIASADTSRGTITLVVQAVGRSSKKLCALGEGRSGRLPTLSAWALLFAPVEASAWRPCCLSWRPSIRLVTA